MRRVSDFGANDRGAQRQGVCFAHFAESFAQAVQVACIGRIIFAIHALCAGEDAIGTDMNQARTAGGALARQSVGQERVGGEDGERIMGFGNLFDDAHTIDDNRRTGRGEQ